MSNSTFDLIVIGAGPGGYHAAIRGSQLGLKVAVVEKDDGSGNGGIGGVCLNWGCIPSKSLLKNAEIVNHLKHAEEWGITVENWSADIGKAIDRSRKVSKTLTGGIEFLFRKNKIELIKGKAKLLSSTEILVDEKTKYIAKNIIIATGARPRSLPTPGLEIDGKNIITSRNALEMKDKPKSIAIIGASAIGCEFAYYFNAYGVKVRLFEMENHIVPKEDEDISIELEKQFKNQGIEFATSAKISKVIHGKELSIEYMVEGKKEVFNCEKVLLGVGVQPNSDDIGLENLGIKTYGPGFIEVDEYMKTNINGIYAVGDINGKLPLAHVAFDQGVVAAETIAGENVEGIDDYSNMPKCTYCQPQIASIGLSEKEAREKGFSIKVGKVPFQVAGKSVAIGEPNGFTKVITDEDSGEIIGAHIIGPEATELIAEIGMLKMLEGTNLELQKLTHAHPTLSEAVKEAGASVNNEAIHF